MSNRAYNQGKHEGFEAGFAQSRLQTLNQVLVKLAEEKRKSTTLTIDLMGLERAREIIEGMLHAEAIKVDPEKADEAVRGDQDTVQFARSVL